MRNLNKEQIILLRCHFHRKSDNEDSEEMEQNRANGFQMNRQAAVAAAAAAAELNRSASPALATAAVAGVELQATPKHRYQNIPLPVTSVGVSSSSLGPLGDRLQSDSLYPEDTSIGPTVGNRERFLT